jgi:hypothetical protein
VRAGADVRLAVEVPPSSRERAMKLRGTLWHAGKLVMGLALVLFLSVHAQEVWSSAVRANPAYAVGEFQFQTNGAISPEVAARVAGLHRNMHVLDIDLEDVRQRLEMLPKVRKVKVERRLPGRLVVELEERLPVAWLTGCAAGYTLAQQVAVDASGMVIPCDEMHRSYVNLPEIEAHEGVVAVIGQTVKSMEMLRAIELLDLMKGRQWHEPRAVRKIEVPGTWNVTAVVRPHGRFIFPVEGNSLSLCLDRLQAVLHATVREGQEVATVDLQPVRNVPVTFVADEPESVALEFSDEEESAEGAAEETAAVAPVRGSGKTEKTEKSAVSGGARSIVVTARPARTAVPQSGRPAAGNARSALPAQVVSAKPVVAKPSVTARKSLAAKSTVTKPKSSAAAKSTAVKSATVRAPAVRGATGKTAAKSSPAKPAAVRTVVRKTVAPGPVVRSAGVVRGSAAKPVPVKAGSVRADAAKPVVRKNVSGPKGIPASVRGGAMKPANSRT